MESKRFTKHLLIASATFLIGSVAAWIGLSVWLPTAYDIPSSPTIEPQSPNVIVAAASDNDVSDRGVPREIESFISKQVKTINAVEYKDVRKIIFGDLDRDGREDAVVLYTLESMGGFGNNWSQYAAVFRRTKADEYRYVTKKLVGGRNYSSAHIDTIENGEVRLNTKDYVENDPSCCPSRDGQLILRLSGKQLKEVKR